MAAWQTRGISGPWGGGVRGTRFGVNFEIQKCWHFAPKMGNPIRGPTCSDPHPLRREGGGGTSTPPQALSAPILKTTLFGSWPHLCPPLQKISQPGGLISETFGHIAEKLRELRFREMVHFGGRTWKNFTLSLVTWSFCKRCKF